MQPAISSRSRRRWVVLFVAAGLTLLLFWSAHRVHPFLAPNHPVDTKYLVVEGWVPDYALEAAAREYHRGQYSRLYTTGGPLVYGSYLAEYRSYAEASARALEKLGLSTNEVVAVPSSERVRNRTFAAACALRDYLDRTGTQLEKVNVISLGAHSRRTQLCFSRALGPGVEVGILSIENREYDPSRWWWFSEGVKTVGGEVLGWLYAWLTIDYGT